MRGFVYSLGMLCVLSATAVSAQTVSIKRTDHGVAHIKASDLAGAAYGMAYAHAQDNVCQTAQQLVTIRGERSRFFGPKDTGMLGRRMLPNAQVDLFIASHMDDAKLSEAWTKVTAEEKSMIKGYIAGYNQYLKDHAVQLPKECQNSEWVKPMTEAEFYRLNELTMVQAGILALADGKLGAQPPKATSSLENGALASATLPVSEGVSVAGALELMRDIGLVDSPLGSNAWAFGKQVTANQKGMLLGNPHFPWVGVNRFWQVHLEVPGKLNVMGAALGHAPIVQIGFNKDIAWSHTVSTGKRFTVYQLKLDPHDPTAYMVDGKSVKMTPQTVTIKAKGPNGQLMDISHTVWNTQWGPVVVYPQAGFTWTTSTAFALKDVNTNSARSMKTWLDFDRATSLEDLSKGMRNLGMPWVNVIAIDKNGNVMYADNSAIPNISREKFAQCAPSPQSAALLSIAELAVLDGSRSECDWTVDARSPVAGLAPVEDLPTVVRQDWVHNSNDSYAYTRLDLQFPTTISPLLGDDIVRRPRTRSEFIQIQDLLQRGPVTIAGIQQEVFNNKNLMAQMILPDLLKACEGQSSAKIQAACAVLAKWNRVNDLDAQGAHLFRLFWRSASKIKNVYREPYDKARPIQTPAGLNMADAAVASQVLAALESAVDQSTAAGWALDAKLGDIQRAIFDPQGPRVHGGDEIEGVLNNIGDRLEPGIHKNGIRVDYGTSYIQAVTFDQNGPVAEAILTYGQSTNPASPHKSDQLKLYSEKKWSKLPFHEKDIDARLISKPLVLTPKF